MTQPVYLDYAATTPVDADVARVMNACLTDNNGFGNSSSGQHAFGRKAEQQIEWAREQVAKLIGASADEIVWTSCATEADNLAIIGAAQFRAASGRHIITAASEHPAVLDACQRLARQGFELTILPTDARGIIDPGQVADALTDATTLVSIMHVNNEIGVVQDIAAIGAVCRAHGALFHVDAAQSACHLPIDVAAQSIDMLSLSAQKMYGPKGIGALYLNHERVRRLEPLMYGGSQEGGLRPGTVPTHQVMGMGEACRIVMTVMHSASKRITALRDRLWAGIGDIQGVLLNGDSKQRVCHILNVSVTGVEGESLHYGLRGLAVSAGSACTTLDDAPSAVLRGLGRSDQLARASVRFSFGRPTTEAEIDFAVETFAEVVAKLRGIAPTSASASV
ncbi:MAG TPA: aminotransferase class V-fold PLP-dependent enzyme [Gammaproteobacteria bacterium]|jgi:cysteine desulfurase|nr:aminotransferase class V-fold PLP-dependent enzyme [Gammaproteobacteria bacterium]MDP7153691.1 aminotransferase class V-fold PLP-dependent enzyme [Gammaproteobacteria bacterium]MDP7297420.1 aminotransferase class V-fold PLP-dependent enzyme [Gammaproteobacteria bacterium]MDP7660696.1 aminotransferase class V-fold PLP-dependent enzyme [Gammaproteobacteria bacterium]HJP39052.1 aminotransferase class V-fold PLP-dependent enzyme [Gammaproteobacteria bacterium]